MASIPLAAIAVVAVVVCLFMLSYAPNFNGFGVDMTTASAEDVLNFQWIWIAGMIAGIAVLFSALWVGDD